VWCLPLFEEEVQRPIRFSFYPLYLLPLCSSRLTFGRFFVGCTLYGDSASRQVLAAEVVSAGLVDRRYELLRGFVGDYGRAEVEVDVGGEGRSCVATHPVFT